MGAHLVAASWTAGLSAQQSAAEGLVHDLFHRFSLLGGRVLDEARDIGVERQGGPHEGIMMRRRSGVKAAHGRSIPTEDGKCRPHERTRLRP